MREIALLGLENCCHFEKQLASYESLDDGVVATFQDGTTATGDVLVGADGIRSVVRSLRAPQLITMDAGVQAIYGRVAYDVAEKLLPPDALTDIFSIVMDDRKLFLGTGAVKLPTGPEAAARAMLPSVAHKPREDYVVCIVGGRHELFPKSDTELRSAKPEELQALAGEMLAAWPKQRAGWWPVVTAIRSSSLACVQAYPDISTRPLMSRYWVTRRMLRRRLSAGART